MLGIEKVLACRQAYFGMPQGVIKYAINEAPTLPTTTITIIQMPDREESLNNHQTPDGFSYSRTVKWWPVVAWSGQEWPRLSFSSYPLLMDFLSQ